MTKTASAATPRATLSVRPGASRNLLAKKAAERAASAPADEGEKLEDMFPAAATTDTANDVEYIEPAASAAPLPSDQPSTASDSASEPEPAAPAVALLPAPSWSSEDEAAFQAMTARRRAAGFQRRGRDVSNQVIRVGAVQPNPDTIVAVIVGLVAAKTSVGRAELIDLMASATFPHPKAQPTDKTWALGYVAGALRQGFLALGEPSPACRSTDQNVAP